MAACRAAAAGCSGSNIASKVEPAVWPKENDAMWVFIAVVLLVMWVLGFLVFHIAGFLIHILLLVAVVAVVLHFVRGRRTP